MNRQAEYYQKRAKEYEQVYQKSERQADLQRIERYLEKQFLGKPIIEIACGTGYWTEKLANNCASILAMDINQAVIEIAGQKSYPHSNVAFEVLDFNKLEAPKVKFEGLFGGFIWSHLLKEEIPSFLALCLSQIKEGSELVFIDNKYVAGSNTPVSRTDKNGNTYQERKLKSGETFEILKNFPDQGSFASLIGQKKTDFEWIELDYYWIGKFNG